MTDSVLKILLIEDDESFAWLVQKNCGHHNVTHVVRVNDALQHLAESEFDVVLTDLTLPDAIELESVEKLRAFNTELPLIVLTSLKSVELATRSLQTGAQEFIVKDHATAEYLDRAIHHAIERQKIAAENTRLVQRLESKQQQLNEKNKRLTELVDTAHRFTDNVSHEFRTPLTVIREYASLMRDGLLGEINDEQAKFLDVIGYRVDDLNRMVDDMLDSSKLSAGIMGLHRLPIAPLKIIERPLAGLELKARVRGVKLSFEADDNLHEVFCDAEKAGRVLTNLVSNAIKFCDEGTGHVIVRLRNRPEDAAVEISVSDNGPGIETEHLDQLFERFRQLGTSTQSSTKGFGLGLNIARELVDQNYGIIEVESQHREGTTFRFTVPVNDWPNIVRQYTARVARDDSTRQVAVVRVELSDGPGESASHDMDSFWRFTQRPTDLIRQTGPAEWTLLLACSTSQVDSIVERFKSVHSQIGRSRPTPLPDLQFQSLGSFVAATEFERLLKTVSDSTGRVVERPVQNLKPAIRGPQRTNKGRLTTKT